MPQSVFQMVMSRIGRVLNDAGLPYMVIGGQAVIHHGEPRATRDIDLTLQISPSEADRVVDLLDACGLSAAVPEPADFVRRTHILPCQARAMPVRVDFAFTDSHYETQAIARGEDVDVDGVPVRFATVEDLLIHKLLAWRPVDQQDVHGVLLKNPDADIDYVRRWARAFEAEVAMDVTGRLDQALRDARG